MLYKKKALLALEDGRIFRGDSFGYEGEAFGEIVFNTSMTGYQEILTDPSYAGQIICMTYPLIGNYGVNSEDAESRRPWAEGFVVREASRITSNFRSEESLDSYLKKNKIVGIEKIDTRALVRHIRDKGAMRAGISAITADEAALLERIKAAPEMKGRELAGEVSIDKAYEFPAEGKEKYHIACYDFGVKRNSLREFSRLGCRLTVVPSNTKSEEILALKPDGIFLSNGPGDPSSMKAAIAEIKKLTETGIPIFGICLGHQLLGLSFGASTFKMLFGHRGGNQPIKDLKSGKIEITSHNHGFAIEAGSLPEELEVTHINANDNTIAGIRHKSKKIFSVQYHPEASPGPNDAKYHFDKFIEMMNS